jgi:hypothetical protein
MDTYSEGFIQHNTDILVNKIKSIYKDGYIFTKEYIIQVLRHAKDYPLVQIDSALDKMVNDKSVYIYDQFNRRGNLANVKEYYFFQPIEIDDTRISLYDRARPVDGKFSSIKVALPEDIQDDDAAAFSISNYVKELKLRFLDTQSEHDYTAITKEVDWYKSAGNARVRLDEIVLDNSDFNRMIAEHMIDTADFNERVKLYEYAMETEKNELSKLLHVAVKDRIISHGGDKYVLLTENDDVNAYIYKDGKFELAQPRDDERVKEKVTKEIKDAKFNNVIGFSSQFNKKYVVFKTKDVTQKQNRGARCDQKTKTGIESEITELLKSAGIDETMAPHSETKKGIAKTKKIQNAKELCTDLEILIRYFDMTKKNGVRWYMNSEEYSLNQQNA